MLVSDVQKENAKLSIEVTLSGIVTLASDEHSWNSQAPIEERPLPMLTLVRDVHS